MSEPQMDTPDQVFELTPNESSAPACCGGTKTFLRVALYGVAVLLLTGVVAVRANPQLSSYLGFLPEQKAAAPSGCCHMLDAVASGCCSVEACPDESLACCHAEEELALAEESGMPPAVPMPETL